MAPRWRVVILSYHFYPSVEVGAKRLSELALSLRDRGFPVTVIAAGNSHDTGDPRLAGLRSVRVRQPPRLYPLVKRWLLRRGAANEGTQGAPESAATSPSTLRFALSWLKRQFHALEWLVDNQKLWSLKALFPLLRELGEGPAVVISSGPPMSPHITALVARTIRPGPWIMDMRDPWVGNDSVADEINSALRRGVERWMEARCLRHAQQITVTAPGLLRKLAARRPEVADKTRLILNGFDGLPLPPAGGGATLRLLYAGTLYFNRDPFRLLEAFGALLERPGVARDAVSFLLVGRCAEWNGVDVADWVRRRGLSDRIEVRKPVAPKEVIGLLADATVAVVFAQGQPEQIPAKVYDYLGAGREMLVIAEHDCDTARLVRRSDGGRVVAPDDQEAMVEVLASLYDHYVVRGRRFQLPEETFHYYSRGRQNGEFLSVIQRLCSAGAMP